MTTEFSTERYAVHECVVSFSNHYVMNRPHQTVTAASCACVPVEKQRDSFPNNSMVPDSPLHDSNIWSVSIFGPQRMFKGVSMSSLGSPNSYTSYCVVQKQ